MSGVLLAEALEEALMTENRRGLEHAAPMILDAVHALRAGAEVVRGEDLIGMKDVAELVGVDRTTASRWLRDEYLPPPFARPAQGPVWLRPVIAEFAEKHRASADAAGRRPVGTAQR